MVERKREPLASTVYPKEVEVVKCLCIPTHGRLIKSWLQLDLCYALPFVLSAIVLFAGPLKCASLMPPWPLVAPVCNNRHTTVEAAGTSVCPWERKAIAGVDTHKKKNPSSYASSGPLAVFCPCVGYTLKIIGQSGPNSWSNTVSPTTPITSEKIIIFNLTINNNFKYSWWKRIAIVMFSIIEQLTLYHNIPDGSVAGLSCNLDFCVLLPCVIAHKTTKINSFSTGMLYLPPASHYFGWNGVLFLFYNTESFTRV